MATRQTAHVLRAADAEVLAGDPGSSITLLADPDTTGGLLTSNRSLLRAGAPGTPAHFHRDSAELLFILDGSLDVLLTDQVITLTRHDLVVVPPGMTHAFAAAADSDAELLAVFAPGTARFDYYRLLDQAHRGQAGWDRIDETQDRFDNHYVDNPLWQNGRRLRS